jgi:hypothetical protein
MAWRVGCEKAPNISDPLAIPYGKPDLTESQAHCRAGLLTRAGHPRPACSNPRTIATCHPFSAQL